MNSQLGEQLIAQAQQGGYAYVRNLVAAESAILRGQFNVAKILRASAHAHRVLAMQAARLADAEFHPTDLLRTNLAEFENALNRLPGAQEQLDVDAQTALKQSALVRERARDLVRRSIASLETHPDVIENEVAQSLWGCYNCGYIAEGDRPDACVVCGALAVEFEWFGPFYAANPEHLGQLPPSQILAILEHVPSQVSEIISGVDDELLGRKPSVQEWCVKEIIGHIMETDLLFAKRVATLLEGQGVPDLTTPIPPWKLHEGKGYEHMPADELVERLSRIRSATLMTLRGLNLQQWSRRGTLRGTSTSLLDLGTWLANHDRGHTAQIRRLCG